MRGDNLVRNGEPEPDTPARLLRREIGIVNLFLKFLRNADAGIPNLNHRKASCFRLLKRCRDINASALRHRLDAVLNEIEERLPY